jgi:hypothetical protein
VTRKSLKIVDTDGDVLVVEIDAEQYRNTIIVVYNKDDEYSVVALNRRQLLELKEFIDSIVSKM